MIVGTANFNGTVAILGLARSGLSAARALMAGGNQVAPGFCGVRRQGKPGGFVVGQVRLEVLD